MAGLLSALLLSVGLGSIAPPPLLTIPAPVPPSSLAESVAAPAPTPAAFSADPHLAVPYFGARYYGSKIGRFTTVDPKLNITANLANPQKWNRYAYGLNNPLRYVDPDGREEGGGCSGSQDCLAVAEGTLDLLIGTVEGVLTTVVPGLEIQPTNEAQRVGQIGGQVGTIVGAFRSFAKGGVAAKEVGAATNGETRFTAAGRRAHAEEPLPPGFERDVRLPSGKRMDAYNAAEKQVIEIKPNNPRAIRRGQRQVEGYCDECDQAIAPGHIGQVQTYDPAKYLKDQ